jgi:hypothetical protein
MNINDTLEILTETRKFLLEDYVYVHGKDPTRRDLLKHIKKSYNEGDLDEILEEVLLEYDLDNIDDDYKILLLVAASYNLE